MDDMTQFERLSPAAKWAWKRIESEFPMWTACLDICNGEMECAVPAPSGSKADHLVIFSHEDSIWVRFSPPHMCYGVDDEDEMASIVRQLITDQAIFKVTMKGDEWVETTLIRPQHSSESSQSADGHTVHIVSWSGRQDR